MHQNVFSENNIRQNVVSKITWFKTSEGLIQCLVADPKTYIEPTK